MSWRLADILVFGAHIQVYFSTSGLNQESYISEARFTFKTEWWAVYYIWFGYYKSIVAMSNKLCLVNKGNPDFSAVSESLWLSQNKGMHKHF